MSGPSAAPVPAADQATREPQEVATAIAAAVLADPSVVRLDAGPFGTVTTSGPGRRIRGVAVPGPGEAVEIAVIARLSEPLDRTCARLRTLVRAVAGPVAVDVTVVDINLDIDEPERFAVP